MNMREHGERLSKRLAVLCLFLHTVFLSVLEESQEQFPIFTNPIHTLLLFVHKESWVHLCSGHRKFTHLSLLAVKQGHEKGLMSCDAEGYLSLGANTFDFHSIAYV